MDKKEEEKILLTDLFEVETLQRIQDTFADMCGFAIGISNANGEFVTNGSSPSEFCENFNKKSPIGLQRCEQCDRRGGEIAMQLGKTVTYHCHAGLVDFAAPIVANGQRIGCIAGGQVRTEELDEDRLRLYAEELGCDPEEYVNAARKIRYVDKEMLSKATGFLQQMSQILSDMAYNQYALLQANEEIEQAARMKSDFLANMSHEIRTPMNAVIGMAEMSLREDLPPVARGYVNQIISSGKTLLTIINDILDYSKIEAGKMVIEEEEYEPMSVINDVANIVNTRIGEKDLELILDISPSLPRGLIGDCNRIKQVIINLANNAVKFTRKGEVVLSVRYRETSEDMIDLEIAVKDTGIGIKKEDLPKIFNSFQQLDSKRNRNIEGTGLGLTISKRIVDSMNGKMNVESEYEKGSVFSFCIPQRISDRNPSVDIKDKEKIVVAGLVANGYLGKHLERDMHHLNIPYVALNSEAELETIAEGNIPYFFVGQKMFTPVVEDFVRKHPEIKVVLMIDFRNSIKRNLDNLMVVKKPVYVLNLAAIFNGEEQVDGGIGYGARENFEFIAPDARILIVDDNAINLTVAEGLLRPLQMQIETAESGKQAVEMISEKMYDLIFMDHMMPELDGVETTHIIRRFHREYDDIPIIALTANAVSGTKEMFLREGMNDFVAKPIEMRTILTKLRTWLPKYKIKKIDTSEIQEDDNLAELMQQPVFRALYEVEGMNVRMALEMIKNPDLFLTIVKDYYRAIEKKSMLIKQLEEDEDWHGYTIEVHALKSSSRQIGLTELADLAARLEQAGNECNGELIHDETDILLAMYCRYQPVFSALFEEQSQKTLEECKAEVTLAAFAQIKEAVEELDMDRADEILEELMKYQYPDEQQVYLDSLQEAITAYDADSCMEIIFGWEQVLED